MKHASDLADGDPIRRDIILQDYYQYTLGEKRSLETQKRAASVKAVETPASGGLADIPFGSASDVSSSTEFNFDDLRKLFLKEAEEPPPPVIDIDGLGAGDLPPEDR